MLGGTEVIGIYDHAPPPGTEGIIVGDQLDDNTVVKAARMWTRAKDWTFHHLTDAVDLTP